MRIFIFLLMILLFLDGCGVEAERAGSQRQDQAHKTGDVLTHEMDVPLPGKPTRFDYQSLDPDTGSLYMAHMGDGTVTVFDTRTNRVIANLPGFPRVSGVLVVPSLKRLYASVTNNHEVAVMDTETLQVIKRIGGVEHPDGLAFSPETQKVFVSDESGKAEIVIDTRTNEHVTTIDMGGEVGNTQYDPTSHLIYACVQTRDQLVAIDPASDTIITRYALKGGRHPHGLLIDDAHQLAYIACQGNSKLLIFNLQTHAIENALSIGLLPDVLAFDRQLNLLYVASELGPVCVFRYVEREGKLVVEGRMKVGSNAHSVSVDSATHRAYFPLKSVHGAPTLRIMVPRELSSNNADAGLH